MPASSRRGGGWGHGAVSVPFHENYKKAAAPFWEESSEHGHSFQDDQGSRTGHLCVSRGAGGDTRRGLVTQVQGSRDPVGGQTSKITRNANGSEPSGSCLSPRNELLALEAKRPVAQASVCTGGGCVCKPSNQPPGPAMGQRHSQDHDSAAHTHDFPQRRPRAAGSQGRHTREGPCSSPLWPLISRADTCLGDQLVVIGQVGPAVDTAVGSVAVGQIRLESFGLGHLHHRGALLAQLRAGAGGAAALLGSPAEQTLGHARQSRCCSEGVWLRPHRWGERNATTCQHTAEGHREKEPQQDAPGSGRLS